MTTSLRYATSFAALGAALACGPSTPSETIKCGDATALASFPDKSAPAIKLGTSTAAGDFAALTPGQAVSIVHGAQGGQHVWGAAMLYAPTKDKWVLSFKLTDGSGKVVANSAVPVDACAGGVAVVTNERVVFLSYPTPPVSGVLSVDAQLLAGADGGAVLHDEVAITAN